MPKLTKTYIDKIQPPANGYEVHWDDSVRGYGLRVSPPLEPGKPARKAFIVMGRVKGKSLQFTIGAYGTYTEDKARKRAQAILQDMREGKGEPARASWRRVEVPHGARPGGHGLP